MLFYEYPTLSYHLKAVFYIIWCFLLCFLEIPFTIDCRTTYISNAVTERNPFKLAATDERIIAYLRRPDCDTCQSCAIAKRPAANRRNTVGNDYARKAVAIAERIKTDSRNGFIIILCRNG